MALGSSFSATQGAVEENAQQRRRRPGAQQSLQTLALELPKTLGADQLAPSANVLGAFRPGSQDAASAQLSRMMRAMTTRAKVRKPVGPKQAAPASAAPSLPQTAPPAMPQATPAPAKPVKSGSGGSKGGSKGSAYEAPEKGDPGYVGGGYVDSIPNPPAQMAPTPPPTQAAPPPTQVQTPLPSYGSGANPSGGGVGKSEGGSYYDPQRNMWITPGLTHGY
jgi:hypothetical protein